MIIYYSNLTNSSKHIPIGGLPTDLGCLVSYAHQADFLDKKGRPWWCEDGSFFMDSGAFTADSKGKPIDIKVYNAYLEKVGDRCDVIAALDVIKNWQGSLANWEIHRKELSPHILAKMIPVFHESEPIEVLYKYAETAEYIGLGGVAGFKNKQKLQAWLDRVYTEFPDRSKVKFHGFGIMDPDLILRYPWGSVDASTPCVLARFGQISTPWKISGMIINPKMGGHALPNQQEYVKELRAWVESIGCDYDLACQQDDFGTNERARISVINFETLRHKVPERFEHKKAYFI